MSPHVDINNGIAESLVLHCPWCSELAKVSHSSVDMVNHYPHLLRPIKVHILYIYCTLVYIVVDCTGRRADQPVRQVRKLTAC